MGEGDVQRVSNVGGSVTKSSIVGVVDELANINLIMGGHYIQLGGYKEEKSYNYQCKELKLMCKDIIMLCNGCPKL